MKERTLRDWFAGQALAGLLANPEKDYAPRGAASESFDYADAMMAEREKGQECTQTYPALPGGLQPVPEGYVYAGQGGQLQCVENFWGFMMAPHENRWSHGCWAGDECDYHYAVHHSDLHKITPKA